MQMQILKCLSVISFHITVQSTALIPACNNQWLFWAIHDGMQLDHTTAEI